MLVLPVHLGSPNDLQMCFSQFQHSNVLVQKAWWNGVVPVVTDAENSVQEKALDCLDQILLQNIKPYNKFRSDDRQKLAWDLLSLSSESKELG